MLSVARAIRGLSHELIQVMDRTINPRHGLIQSLQEDPPAAEGIRVVHASVSPPAYFRGNAPTRLKTIDRGTGAAFNRESACWGAIGEALERYAASIYWPEQLVFGSAADYGADAINLNRLVRVGKPQVRIFNAAAPRAWAKGTDIVTGRGALVPAAMTYLGYVSRDDDEIISQSDSTGLACGQSPNAATLNALCELVERDLFASTWMLLRHPPRLDVGIAIERLDLPVQLALKSRRLDVELFYLGREFGVHGVVCLVRSPAGHGIVASAASPYILRAIEKAVCEGLYTFSVASRHIGRKVPQSLDEIRAPADHLAYYLNPERFATVRSVFSSPDTQSLIDLLTFEPAHLTAYDIAASMANGGIVATSVDLTTPDVGDLGMSVVRVVAPGLQPLVFGPACVLAPDRRRLNHWRERWKLKTDDLNPNPHPFP